MKRPDCWKVLGINPTRNPVLIRNAFRKQAKRYHPDSSTQHISIKKFNFFEVKVACNEALQMAQSDSLSTTNEALSENFVYQTYSTPQLNYLFNYFSDLSLNKFLRTLSVFPVMLVFSFILEKIQNSLDLINALELIISIILGLIDGMFFGIFGILLFFWLPGLGFILLLWAGIRTKTGNITLIFCWVVCLTAYFIEFSQTVSSLGANEEIRRNVGSFLALVILPSFLLGRCVFLSRKQVHLERSQVSTP